MFDSVQDELVRLPSDPSPDEIAVNPLSSVAEVRSENGEHASACVFSDDISVSGFGLAIRVNGISDRELVIRPRADDCCTVAMRICEDTVCNKVEIELPARCSIASEAQIRDGEGKSVCARVLRDCTSPSGFVLEVSVADGRRVIVRPCAYDGKLVAIRPCGNGEHRAYRLLEVVMPKHVMTAPAPATP
jgi:hypothetical protein